MLLRGSLDNSVHQCHGRACSLHNHCMLWGLGSLLVVHARQQHQATERSNMLLVGLSLVFASMQTCFWSLKCMYTRDTSTSCH